MFEYVRGFVSRCNKCIISSVCNRRFVLFILCLPLIIYQSVQFYFNYIPPPIYMFRHMYMNSQCIIPDLDPFDETIMKHYIWHPSPIICDNSTSLLFIDNIGNIQINRSVYPVAKKWDLNCTYSIVELSNGDRDIKFLPEIHFLPPISIAADVFLVKCEQNNKLVYKDILHKIDFENVIKTKHIQNETDEQLSVFMFGLDSISRLTAIRKLPKTLDYIENKLQAYVFKGYNKIGDNTYPNLVALLTGKFDGEHHINQRTEYMDKFNLIWNNFSDAKYVTMHAEDWPEIATFNHGCKGFSKEPVDHYLRKFFLAMRKVQPFHYKVEQVFLFIERYVQLRKRSALCFGNRKIHMIVIEYFKQFINAYKGKLKFGFSWLTELSHNFINFIEVADNDFYEFFKWLHENKHLQKSILIFYSDHGSRQDEIRNTYIGRIEDRMPIFSMVLPDHIKRKYPHIHKNLQGNTKKLTATFDVFQTLRDILKGDFSLKDTPKPTHAPWGKSLFEEMSENRTCVDASIPENYCSCYTQKKIDTKDVHIAKIGNYIKDEINEKLKIFHDKCAKLSLVSIRDATYILLPLKRTPKKEIFTLRNYFSAPETGTKERYLVTIETVPGNGRFEATVDYSADKHTMEIIGDIDRTNRYGNQSVCINHRIFRLYCYCI